MKTASVSELKAGLSGYLKHVKEGEEIIVTERGKIIARVIPYERTGPTDAEYDEMVKAGILRPPRIPGGLPPEFWDLPAPEDPEGHSLKYLLEDRREGR